MCVCVVGVVVGCISCLLSLPCPCTRHPPSHTSPLAQINHHTGITDAQALEMAMARLTLKYHHLTPCVSFSHFFSHTHTTGITDAQALQMAKGLAVTGDVAAAAEQIKGLYKLFDSCDCTMVEVRVGFSKQLNPSKGCCVNRVQNPRRYRQLFDSCDSTMVEVRVRDGG